MLYISQLLETQQLEQLIEHYPVGVEVISFSIGYVLDDLEQSIAYYQKEFVKLRGKVPLTFHGPFLDLLPGSCDQRVRQLAEERFEASYKAAQAFGVAHMIFHTGYIPNTYPDRYWLENIVAFWKRFLENKSETCMFYIENVLDTEWHLLKEIIDRVGKPNLKVCLDIGHVNAYSQRTVEEWIGALGERIGYVHLHNNDGTRDAHEGLLYGTLPMQEIIKMLKSHAPKAHWSLEISDETMLRESLEWLEKENRSIRR